MKGEGEGLIFFTKGREGGGELKKERRLDFFPANLKHAFSLLLSLSLNLKVKTKNSYLKKNIFISILRN